ncbi:MAG TPA: peptidylprolyl isomerase [Cerasibacillus sp.]|uniref:peptidylprolyl isomerase n=1 Tax=Cerasibacillus sp. TaxID=2498711 RepID=UPI002F3FE136
MKRLIFMFIGLFFVFTVLTACGGGAKEKDVQADSEFNGDNPVATITMEDGGKIVMELYPEVASNTVHNFISLVENKFYDGLIFHRVIPGFMIQGGDPNGNGTGGPGYAIEGEFSSNGFENELEHVRGVVSMARSTHPDSAGSQFFIMTDNATHLDGEYAAFGKVIDGMDVVDQIVQAERDEMDKPFEDQKIKTITIDKKGNTFPEPKKK